MFDVHPKHVGEDEAIWTNTSVFNWGVQPPSSQTTMGFQNPTCVKVFMVNNLVSRWPKPSWFDGFGGSWCIHLTWLARNAVVFVTDQGWVQLVSPSLSFTTRCFSKNAFRINGSLPKHPVYVLRKGLTLQSYCGDGIGTIKPTQGKGMDA